MSKSMSNGFVAWLRRFLVVVVFLGISPVQAAGPTTLVLADDEPRIDAWPAVRTLADPGGTLDWRTALSRWPAFATPQGRARNLGNQTEPVWLALEVRTADGDGQWVFDLDYPPLNEARLYVVADGQLVSQALLGSSQPFEARPMRTRTHAVTLALSPGVSYRLLLRLRTDSAMLLPLTLSKPAAYHEREAGRLVSQGLIFGLSLALLAYCIVNGVSLRNGLFLLYGLLLLSSTAFFVDFTGLGQQFLWSERQGLTAMISPLSMLVAMIAGGLFVMGGLDTRRRSPRLHTALVGLTIVATLLVLLSLVGWLSYRQARSVSTVLGPFVPLLAIPPAWRRARSGDPIGAYMLVGWACYVFGAVTLGCLLRGFIPANFFTMNLFQWSTLLEMLAWMRVLSLRIEAIRRKAQRIAAEVQGLSSLARTDELTGLTNRRGLDAALEAALPQARTDAMLALYLIDLDGFKAVNDSLGHGVGDQVLVEVGRRLVQALRRSDVVARLGGDEFVVLANGLSTEDEASVVGAKLLSAFAEPIVIDAHPCPIGLTIGFVLAPLDGNSPLALMHLADAAMYAGKRAGGRRALRGGAPDTAIL